jgi:ABC-type nitrate/sulfonate/bicarbonate transport system substrate-binding protein
MTLDLDDDEKAALIELLRAQTKNTRWAAPRITELRAILAKLAPEPQEPPRPTALRATPNPRSRQGAVLAKKRRR